MRSTERNEGPTGILRRALAILECFDMRHTQRSLAEIAEGTGLPKSTVHRLLAAMCEERLVERTASGTYRLGLRHFEFGEMVPTHRSLVDAAEPIMADLRESTGLRIHLAILDGVDVLYLRIVGTDRTSAVSRVGGRLPSHVTGVGKAMLAYSPGPVVRARIEAGLPRFTPRTIITPGDLTRELARIRREGIAQDREECVVGSSCVAAPVFGSTGTVTAALSITGVTRRMDPSRYGLAVQTAALTLGRSLRESGL